MHIIHKLTNCLYIKIGVMNRMVIAKRMRRRRREVGGIGCICEAEKESVVHGLSQRAETVPEWLEVVKDIFGSRNLSVLLLLLFTLQNKE